jgi:hypothetical protein
MLLLMRILKRCPCRCYPAAPLYAIGYSLGALLLTKYLAEEGQGRCSPLCTVPALAARRNIHAVPVPSKPQPFNLSSNGAPGHVSSAPVPPAKSSSGEVAHLPVDDAVGLREPQHISDNAGCASAQMRSLQEARTKQGENTPPAPRSLHAADRLNAHDSNGAGSAAARAGGVHADGAVGKEGIRCGGHLTAAVVVGSPFDMQVAADKISKPWSLNWVYNLVLTFRCASLDCLSASRQRLRFFVEASAISSAHLLRFPTIIPSR